MRRMQYRAQSLCQQRREITGPSLDYRNRSSRTPGSKCRSMKSARPSKTLSRLGATRPNRAFMTEGFSKRPWTYQPITGPACQLMGSWSSPYAATVAVDGPEPGAVRP